MDFPVFCLANQSSNRIVSSFQGHFLLERESAAAEDSAGIFYFLYVFFWMKFAVQDGAGFQNMGMATL